MKKLSLKKIIAGLLFIAIILINLNANSLIVQAAYTPSQSNAFTYGYHMFSEDYTSGYIYITNGTSRGCIVQGNDYWPNNPYINIWFTTTSRTRNSNIYVDHYNGAYMNGESYDIREYIYIPDGGTMGIAYDTGEMACYNANRAVREFHFYKSGTLNSNNPVEVSFKGIIQLTDFDDDEGYYINNINNAYLTNPTNIRCVGYHTWLGTIENSPNWDRDTLWAEVYGSASNPLILTYYAASTHGGSINFNGTNLSGKITYNANGGNGNNIYQIVSFGYNNVIKNNTFTRTGYEFKNWNTNANGLGTTYLQGGTYTINSALTLYAQWQINNYNVTYKDVVDSTSGTVLGQSTVSKKYGSTVKGSDLGNSTADNAYYNGYYYVSDTSATVGTSGATVYRIFKLRTTDVTGSVAWTDNANKWGTRPNSVDVYLYRDGEKIDTTTGLVNSESNEYSFKNLPKYSTLDGHIYNYTVSQSEAVSKTSPEDKYTTTQNIYDFINVLSNTSTGLTVSGSIYWEDNGNSLGYRPSTVTITLYQNGEEYKTVEVDTFNNNTYEFSKLPKYDNELNKYEYTVEETVIANYLVKENGNYVLKDAYTVKADTPNPLDFTNVFNIPSEPPIPVKPEYTNTVTIKTNTEDKIAISLKGMETIINDDLSVNYGTSYNGQVYNVSANNVGEVLSSISSGKYEISYYNASYILNDITCTGDSNIWIEGNDDTYYLVIKDTNSNISGTITLDFSKKDHVGYQSDISVSNYFKVKIETETSTSLETQVFALSRVTVTAEDIYSVIYENSDTVDDNIYNEGDEVEVLDYKGNVPEGTEFIGWALTEDIEEADYLVGDIITIEEKDISLYPVFKAIEESTETETTEEDETETSETEISETEETSQEESTLEEESSKVEDTSTESNSSIAENIVEKESSESSETSESSEIEE